MKDIDKFRGCLIGGAAGDALGYAVEFLDEETIFSRYGENGITQYDLVNGIAEISDDTQMTLFTANGLLLGTTRGMTRGIMGSYPSYIAFCYKDWLRTQCEKYPLNEEYPYSWLINIPELYNRRAPGNTCLILKRKVKLSILELTVLPLRQLYCPKMQFLCRKILTLKILQKKCSLCFPGMRLKLTFNVIIA